ncbi:nickel ABC transporter permease [Alkalihalophilus marmarensis]|uniref:nickel ABC transporter permease n=1 Tax=Alkalihalophilus marmarensis TaxID=521377 RepID=UPI002E21E0A8|nr:nickel ABC transporter permease [Alkalihalophilus marmarensis]MED1602004.1 ABC transporter permease [Alkalihalophilus marmarensis]
MTWWKQIVKVVSSRLLQFIIMILVLSFVTFLLMKITPGDPIRTILKVDDVRVTLEEEQQLREAYGFNQPILVQYREWLSNAIRGDLGDSLITNRPVMDMITSRLPATIGLAAGGIVMLFIIALPLGMLGAIYENKWPDRLSRLIALAGASMPSFWLGLLLIQLFSLHLGILPVMGRGTFAHYILPSITLGIAMAPMYIRLLRERLIHTLKSPYIEAAEARGVRRSRILIVHVLRGSLISIVTLLGLSIGSLLGGITVVEVLFSWPGMGELIVQAVMQRDYPVIQGYILVIGILVVTANLIVDIIYTVLNPQIRYGKEGL